MVLSNLQIDKRAVFDVILETTQLKNERREFTERSSIYIILAVPASGYNFYDIHHLYSFVLYMESHMELQLVNWS